MAVHHTPRMVYQVTIRRIARRAVKAQRRKYVGFMAKLHRGKRLKRYPNAAEHYAEAIAINKKHGIGGPENNRKYRIKGSRKGTPRKVTLPKLTFLEDKE